MLFRSIVCGGLKHRDIYGLSFKPRKLGEKEAEDALSGKLEPLESGNPPDPLHFLHEFGFITACEICCMLMSGINVHYIQYKRNKNLQPYYSMCCIRAWTTRSGANRIPQNTPSGNLKWTQLQIPASPFLSVFKGAKPIHFGLIS